MLYYTKCGPPGDLEEMGEDLDPMGDDPGAIGDDLDPCGELSCPSMAILLKLTVETARCSGMIAS